MQTIVVANQKGGVGKTTTAVTIGTGLADLGYPTVIIDCDPQGNAANFIGENPSPMLYELIVEKATPEELAPDWPTHNTLMLVAGDSSTVDVETLLRTSPRFNPTTVLKDRIRQFNRNGREARETVVIIDTAPSLSSIQIAALCAADWLLIPASPEYASETGIAALSQAIADLQRAGTGIKLLGIVPTMVAPHRREHKQTIFDLRELFPGLVLYPVRNLAAIAEAPRAGQSIWKYAPGAADDYARVLAQVMRRMAL